MLGYSIKEIYQKMLNESLKKRREESARHIVCDTWGPNHDYGNYWYLIFKESQTGDPRDEICLGSFKMGGVHLVKDILEHNGHTYQVTRTEYKAPSFIYGCDILTDKTNVIWVK